MLKEVFIKFFLKVWISSKLFVDPPLPLKFGSKNRYQSPDTISRFVFQYYKNEYQKSLDLGFDPSPSPPLLDKFHTFFLFFWMSSLNLETGNIHRPVLWPRPSWTIPVWEKKLSLIFASHPFILPSRKIIIFCVLMS